MLISVARLIESEGSKRVTGIDDEAGFDFTHQNVEDTPERYQLAHKDLRLPIPSINEKVRRKFQRTASPLYYTLTYQI